MRIESLSLKGLTCFTDAVALDLRELPPGLIAIVGPNGAGKTTLLEAAIAALYRRFPSRSDRPLFAYATDRDAFIDVSFSIEEHGSFRARINLDNVGRSADAVLEHVRPDGSRVSLNDGNVSSFDAAVGRRLPSLDVILASTLSAQNGAGKFVNQKPRERRALFGEFLALQHYEAKSATAKQAAALVEGTRGRLQAVRGIIARDVSDEVLAALERDAHTLHVVGETTTRMKCALRIQLDALEAQLAEVQDQVATYLAARRQVETLQTALTTRRSERCQINLQIGAADTTLTDELSRIAKKRDADQADIANRIAGNGQLLRQAEAIRAAVAAIEALERELGECRDQLERERATQTEAGRALLLTQQTLERLTALDTELARARSDAGLLGTVPCGGAGPYAACRFLTNAEAAAARIPELELRVAGKPSAEAAVQDRRLAYEAHAPVIDRLVVAIRVLTERKQMHQDLARYADRLAAAEARIAELTDKRRRVEDDAAQLERQAHARHDARIQELTGQASALETRIRDLQAELLTAQQTIAATEPAHGQALALQADLATARAAWDDAVASLAHVEAGLQALDRRRVELAAKRRQLAATDAKLGPLESQVIDWRLLATALGPTGLPVLEIDAAGPGISGYTNELLRVGYGSRFTVELVTQQATADGKAMREDFTVQVWDNERGGERREIADLSGGEQVVVAEALMNAIGVYVNTRSPLPIRTAWRDETTGALDPEHAIRYIAMLRKLQELGGLHHVFFITHNPDCAALADAQIQVADGRAALVLPPFTAAA